MLVVHQIDGAISYIRYYGIDICIDLQGQFVYGEGTTLRVVAMVVWSK